MPDSPAHQQASAEIHQNCSLQRVGGSSASREYLVDQLVITARQLADSHIFLKDPAIPFCQVCSTSGIGGRPIPHLKSCAVGRVVSAIEQLHGAPRRWNGWDVELAAGLGEAQA
jgi:hypothetical protein